MKILEIGECMELQAKSSELTESADADFSDISFEELLAQEKKDSFWLVSSVESYVYSLSFATFVDDYMSHVQAEKWET